ncbi:hypothetical protein ACPA54_37380 [Uniformispora flossi]|uniref:hypothetical protein n=1 Tax=Uniformispora flossi TaxID=3390723 RepID=UPI003C2CA36B
MGANTGAAVLDRIVYRWQERDLLGGTGLGPAATSLGAAELGPWAAELGGHVGMAVDVATGPYTSVCWARTMLGPALIHREFALHGRDNAPGNVAHVLLDPGRALAPHAVLALGMFDWAADGPALTDLEPGHVLDPLPADALVAVAHERADGLRAAARDRRVALTAVAAALLARPRATLSLLQRDAGPDPAPLLWGVFDLVSHLARGSWSFSTYETSDDAARPRFVVVPRWPDSAPNGRLRLEADAEPEQTPYGEAARRLVDFYAERPWTETRALLRELRPTGLMEPEERAAAVIAAVRERGGASAHGAGTGVGPGAGSVAGVAPGAGGPGRGAGTGVAGEGLAVAAGAPSTAGTANTAADAPARPQAERPAVERPRVERPDRPAPAQPETRYLPVAFPRKDGQGDAAAEGGIGGGRDGLGGAAAGDRAPYAAGSVAGVQASAGRPGLSGGPDAGGVGGAAPAGRGETGTAPPGGGISGGRGGQGHVAGRHVGAPAVVDQPGAPGAGHHGSAPAAPRAPFGPGPGGPGGTVPPPPGPPPVAPGQATVSGFPPPPAGPPPRPPRPDAAAAESHGGKASAPDRTWDRDAWLADGVDDLARHALLEAARWLADGGAAEDRGFGSLLDSAGLVAVAVGLARADVVLLPGLVAHLGRMAGHGVDGGLAAADQARLERVLGGLDGPMREIDRCGVPRQDVAAALGGFAALVLAGRRSDRIAGELATVVRNLDTVSGTYRPYQQELTGAALAHGLGARLFAEIGRLWAVSRALLPDGVDGREALGDLP